MRNFVRIMAAFALAVMSVAGIGGVVVAAAGSITGSVLTDNGTPINGAHVVAYNWDTGTFVNDAHAGADGTYSITGLSSDNYLVKADYTQYLPEYYNEASYSGGADQVPVIDTETTAGINFTLTHGSSISGYVYQEDNITAPIPIAHVTAYDNVTSEQVGEAYASDNGSYSITTGTGSGSYFVRAKLHGRAEEYYDNVSTKGAATQVAVTAGNDRPNINFTLTQIGWISGYVYGADGVTPVVGAAITAYDNATGVWTAQGHSGSNPGGFYYINLDEGAYRIKATATGYIDQWWNNVTTKSAATPISVVGLNETSGKNFSLLTVQAVTTDPATGVATTSAVLNGTLTSMGAADNVTVFFEWGTTSGSYTETTDNQTLTATGAFSASLSSLAPGNTYYFMAKAVGDGESEGIESSFTTSITQPSVATNDATVVLTTSATLNGNLAALGTAATVNVSFEWGTATGSYTQTTANQAITITGAFSADLAVGSLTPGTTYYYRAVADGDGPPVYGAEKSFTTSITQPSVATNDATVVLTTSATLNGNLSSLGTASSVTVSFEWGTAAGGPYPNPLTVVPAMTVRGAFSANLTGLTPGTKCYYRAKTVGDGTPQYGAEMSFTTSSLPDTTAPVISSVNSSNITVFGATITWSTNELATSQVEYGLTEEYGSTTTLDATKVNSHSVELTDLKAGKTYHYQVISKDAANNQKVSADETFTTTSRSGGMPTWAWVLIGLAAVGVLGAAAYLIRGRLAQG
jgi:hypothetical protein